MMGLFGKLFGSGKATATNKVRAQFKDENYFDKQIERCDLFINADNEDFELYIKKHGALNSNHYITATDIRNKKIENYYSKGAAVSALVPIFEESVGYFLQSWSLEYSNNLLMVQMLSFSILLNVSDKYAKDFSAFTDKWEQSKAIEEALKPHPLVYFLLGKTTPERLGYEPLNQLYQITQQPKETAEKSLQDYLQKWYALHKDQPWYNTHLRENGYSGYWAWEVAAVVKRMKLTDESFKESPFYPYDIVHWNGIE